MKNETGPKGSALDGLLGVSSSIEQLKQNICLYAPLKDESVLIVGETGTGKELVAKAVHEKSERPGGLHPVNCNAFSGNTELIESELFGYKKGAFTGAKKDAPGTLKAAGNGTVFLDEIGDLPLLVQGKLLRAIENGVIRPVGGTKEEKIKCRFIAATNKVRHETFHLRPDLFHRFDHHIKTDPLRERREDAITLFLHFADERCRELGVPKFTEVSFLVAHQVIAYGWPGNVRELRRRTRGWVLASAHNRRRWPLPLVGDVPYFGASTYFSSDWSDRGLKLDPISWVIDTTISRAMLSEWGRQAADRAAHIFQESGSFLNEHLIEQALAAEERLLSGERAFANQDKATLVEQGTEHWNEVRRLEESKLSSGVNSRASRQDTLEYILGRPGAKTDLHADTTRDGTPNSPGDFSIGLRETVGSVVTEYCKAAAELHKNRTEAAESLGISRATLRKYLKGVTTTRLR